MNNVIHWDELERLIRQKITALEHKGRYDQSEYDNLVTDYRRVTQHKRLSYGKLSEALLYSILAKYQTVREAFLKKNLTKLVSKHANPELNISKCSLKLKRQMIAYMHSISPFFI